jgi:hypothetical protein
VGLISLDYRHTTHNIPGKFLSYLQSGLPVIASINSGNDLVDLINSSNIGYATTSNSVQALKAITESIIVDLNAGEGIKYSKNCIDVLTRFYETSTANKKIAKSLGLCT